MFGEFYWARELTLVLAEGYVFGFPRSRILKLRYLANSFREAVKFRSPGDPEGTPGAAAHPGWTTSQPFAPKALHNAPGK